MSLKDRIDTVLDGGSAILATDEQTLSPKQKAYRAHFQKVLKSFGVSSPAELDAGKKKAFFSKVSSTWKGGESVDEQNDTCPECGGQLVYDDEDEEVYCPTCDLIDSDEEDEEEDEE